MNLSHVTKTITDKYKTIEAYFENKIFTGQFIKDIPYLSAMISYHMEKAVTKSRKRLIQSHVLQKLLPTINSIITLLISLPLIGPVLIIFTRFLKIVLFYYADIFIILAITFPFTLLLAHLYQNQPFFFFLLLIPGILWTVIWYAVLFLYIKKRLAGEKITLLNTLQPIKTKIPPLIITVLLQLSIIIQLFIGFFVLAYFLSNLFDYFDIVWSDSFLYWLGVIIVALVLTCILFFIIIVVQQTFFILLIHEISLFNAFRSAVRFFKKHHIILSISGLFSFSVFLFTIQKAIIYSHFTGAGVCIYLCSMLAIFIAFTIFEKYYLQETKGTHSEKSPSMLIPLIIISLGIVNYIPLTLLAVRQHDAIKQFINTQRMNYYYDADLISYVNTPYGYALSYPKTWSRYEISPHEVRIYTNINGTISGGMWLDVTITPFDAQQFRMYYSADIGKLPINDGETSTSYKISNISVDGHAGIQYTVDNKTPDDTSFQTVYLIHKADLLYTLRFTSKSNTTEAYSYGIVEKISNSFRFLR